MDDRSSKIYFGLCMLVLIWIGVYWMWEPGVPAEPKISISTPPVVEQDPKANDAADEEPSENKQQEIEIPPIEPEIVQPRSQLIPPEFRTHIVVQNETMQDIARQYYGKTSLWNVVARANPRIDPLKLREGMTLRIPIDPSNIQGVVDRGDEQEPAQPESNPSDRAVVEYIVQSGDSLSLIAQKFYGSARHADFIYESNKDTLRSKDAIRVGQTLKLPPLDP